MAIFSQSEAPSCISHSQWDTMVTNQFWHPLKNSPGGAACTQVWTTWDDNYISSCGGQCVWRRDMTIITEYEWIIESDLCRYFRTDFLFIWLSKKNHLSPLKYKRKHFIFWAILVGFCKIIISTSFIWNTNKHINTNPTKMMDFTVKSKRYFW